MASIRKRLNRDGSHSWHAQIRKNGFPNQTESFGRKLDADRWATQIEAEMNARKWRDASDAENLTLKHALERYLVDYTANKKGIVAETRRIEVWKRHNLASYSLSKLKGSDFVKHRDARLAEGKSQSTVRLELAIISHLFNMARKEWGFEGLNNPIQDIKMPALAKERNRRLQGDEEKVLLTYCKARDNEWVYPITILAIETAARRGELLKLEWADVDLKNSTALLRDTKNGDDREIPLSSRALKTLNSLAGDNEGQVLKTTDNGFRLSWSRMMKQIAKVHSNFDDLRFHDLRHEATSRLFEKGLGLMEVASITGHKDLKMLRRYTHLKAVDLVKKMG